MHSMKFQLYFILQILNSRLWQRLLSTLGHSSEEDLCWPFEDFHVFLADLDKAADSPDRATLFDEVCKLTRDDMRLAGWAYDPHFLFAQEDRLTKDKLEYWHVPMKEDKTKTLKELHTEWIVYECKPTWEEETIEERKEPSKKKKRG